MIAIVYPQFYGVGGIARYLDSFLANLPDSHAPIYLITGTEHQVSRSYPNVQIIHIPFQSNRFSLYVWGRQVRKLLKQMYSEGKIQWVNFHFPPLIPGLFLPKDIPMVLTAHTTYLGMSGNFYPVKHFDSQWGKLSLLIKSWMERRIFNKSKHVIALTEQGRQEVLQYGYRGPISIIPNGADISKFNPDATVPKDIDVLFCGRIELRKGSRGMVRLCQALVEKQPSISICIVGYGEDDEWVRAALAPYAKNIALTGKVPFEQMMAYYNRSRVYASTSYYEGLPGTCLEAMAMNLPAVVWDFLFYRGLVTDSQTGYVVPPNDYATMAEKIIDLLEYPERAVEMGARGRKVLAERYSWQGLAKKILAVFS